MSDELPSDAELESQFAAAMDAMLAEMREREHRVDEAPGARHREALAHWGMLHCSGEAERLAWGEMLSDWHKRYGRRWPAWQCAGCDSPIGELAVPGCISTSSIACSS